MAWGTSLSADTTTPRGVVLRAVALYVGVIGAAMLIVRISGGGAWPTWVAFGVGGGGAALITIALALPRLRHLNEATSAAESLARGSFDVHVSAAGDEFARLASALNAAGVAASTTIGALRQERAQLEALLNASSDSTLAIDRSGAIHCVGIDPHHPRFDDTVARIDLGLLANRDVFGLGLGNL